MSSFHAGFSRRTLLLAGICSSMMGIIGVRADESGTSEPHVPSLTEQLNERAASLRLELADSDFHLVAEEPFVVVGNEAAARVQQRATATVRWAYEHLKRDYLETTPQEPIVVWVCRDAVSYQQTSLERLKMKPDSPFGFYAPTEKTIIVNIATGSGTLVHELVHSLLATDFPTCPAWFNEGLASLYEECEERNGKIWGLPNWRLRGLQKQLADGPMNSFEELCQHGTERSYLRDRPSAYAHARYLCLYLQEHGLLCEYYQAFRTRHERDPSGYRTLVDVLGQSDMKAFQERWRPWVLELKEEAP